MASPFKCIQLQENCVFKIRLTLTWINRASCSIAMAEILIKSCVYNTFLHVFMILIILSTVDGKNHAGESTYNPQIEKQLDCETLYVNDAVISWDMSEFNSSCLRIMAAPGMGIRMDFRDGNSSWSIYDFFYIQPDQNCEDSSIIALTGKPNPCSTLFNTSALDIHFHASLMLDFSSSSPYRSLLPQVCNAAATVGQSHDSQPCTNLENFNRVHNFRHKIMPYSKLIAQHPSLDLTAFPDLWFQSIELPLLNLATTGKFYQL